MRFWHFCLRKSGKIYCLLWFADNHLNFRWFLSVCRAKLIISWLLSVHDGKLHKNRKFITSFAFRGLSLSPKALTSRACRRACHATAKMVSAKHKTSKKSPVITDGCTPLTDSFFLPKKEAKLSKLFSTWKVSSDNQADLWSLFPARKQTTNIRSVGFIAVET